MAKIMTVNECRVILDVQTSGIGYSYPRFFVELPSECVNIDVTVGGIFKMKKSDFEDWASDAEKVSDPEKVVSDVGVNYGAFINLVAELVNESSEVLD